MNEMSTNSSSTIFISGALREEFLPSAFFYSTAVPVPFVLGTVPVPGMNQGSVLPGGIMNQEV